MKWSLRVIVPICIIGLKDMDFVWTTLTGGVSVLYVARLVSSTLDVLSGYAIVMGKTQTMGTIMPLRVFWKPTERLIRHLLGMADEKANEGWKSTERIATKEALAKAPRSSWHSPKLKWLKFPPLRSGKFNHFGLVVVRPS